MEILESEWHRHEKMREEEVGCNDKNQHLYCLQEYFLIPHLFEGFTRHADVLYLDATVKSLKLWKVAVPDLFCCILHG